MSELADVEVQLLRAARGSAAELKTRLISLRGELPKGLIFVFEGDDDRGVYLSWIRQISAELRYEPFTCGGKSGVLRLWDAVNRDLSGLGEDVYFFVDRDFDDLRGNVANEAIFMTNAYAIENYLVCAEVLDHVLKTEFHCHERPAVRANVLALFDSDYAQFLTVSIGYNRDLHVARQLPLELKKPLPKTVSKLANVAIGNVTTSGVAVAEVVVTDPPINEAARAECASKFDSLEPKTRFRGKFGLAFFRAWLEKLAEERRTPGSAHFAGMDADVKISSERLTLATLAARSDPPRELAEFISHFDHGEASSEPTSQMN